MDGQNIAIERELSDANTDQLREVAAEFVKRNVDVIVALSTTAARPAKQATGVIPIVAVSMADPVDDGLVASLARPGGNVTGTSFLGPQLVTKRLQLLSEVVLQYSRVQAHMSPEPNKALAAGLQATAGGSPQQRPTNDAPPPALR